MTEKKTINYYDQISSLYHQETYGPVRSLRAFARTLRTEQVLKLLDKYSENRKLLVADIGCGPAQYALPIIERKHKSLGLDNSPDMYKKALKEGYETTNMDLERLHQEINGTKEFSAFPCLWNRR